MTEFGQKVLSAVCSLPTEIVEKVEALQKLIVYMEFNVNLYYEDAEKGQWLYDYYRHAAEVYEELMKRYGVENSLSAFWEFDVLDCLGGVPETAAFSAAEGSDYLSYRDLTSFADLEIVAAEEDCDASYELLFSLKNAFNIPKEVLLKDAMQFVFGIEDDVMFLTRFPGNISSYGRVEDMFYSCNFARARVAPDGGLWVLSTYPVLADPDYSFMDSPDMLLASLMMMFRPTFIVGVAKRLLKEQEDKERRDDCA